MNYSRIYIIECDVKVKEIGVLSDNSVNRLLQNFLSVNPQAQQTDGTLYFRPKRTKDLSKGMDFVHYVDRQSNMSTEDTSERDIEDEARKQEAIKIASYHQSQRISELNARERSKRQNVTEAERPSHHATRVSNFPSHTPVQASTSSSLSHTYSNTLHLTAVSVNRTSSSTSTYGTIDRRAEADDMEQKGGANAPKAVESVRLLASLKIANQAGNVHGGKKKATQPVIQLTPASLVAPQVTYQ